ncbi:MAG: DNA polymerase III subunit beta [Mycoplasmoidaceae bacterium]
MKIIINKNELLNGLKFSNNIIGQNIIYPILQSVLIDVEENYISLISSNGISSSKYIINKNFKLINKGKILIKLRTILNIISKLDGDDVLLEQTDNSLLKINCNKFESNLNILNVEEYPNIKFEYDQWTYLKINKDHLIKINRKVAPSVNNNLEKNSVFNGIYFDSESQENCLKVIASDTYKMSYLNFSYSGSKIKLLLDPLILRSILDFINQDVYFYCKENKIIIIFDNIIISTRNIEGSYPNVQKIINQECLYSFKVDRVNLINLLNRGHSLIINENKPIANFKINMNDILISFRSNEIGFASESIEIKSENLNRIEFNINILFLNSLLKSFDNNEIIFSILDDNKPILINDLKEPEFLQILVPLRKS